MFPFGIRWPLLLLGLYLAITFSVALLTERSLKVALLALFALFVQFFGYGFGFLKSTILVNFSNKPPEMVFPKLFFQKQWAWWGRYSKRLTVEKWRCFWFFCFAPFLLSWVINWILPRSTKGRWNFVSFFRGIEMVWNGTDNKIFFVERRTVGAEKKSGAVSFGRNNLGIKTRLRNRQKLEVKAIISYGSWEIREPFFLRPI